MGAETRLKCELTVITGCLYGSRQPLIAGRLICSGVPDRTELDRVCNFLEVEYLLDKADTQYVADSNRHSGTAGLTTMLLESLYHLQKEAGMIVFNSGKLMAESAEQNACSFFIETPITAQTPSADCFRWLVSLANAQLTSSDPEVQLRLHAKVKKVLANRAAKGSNVPRFTRAAFELDIPCLELPGDVQQYGYGSRALWLNSSFTDQTSNIAVRLARDKFNTARILREAGIPVARHGKAKTADKAVLEAENLGYPVVVKPADSDGGQGVSSGLLNEEEVRTAFEAAAKFSINLMVEKHIEGRDYRLNVFNGELIWAIERVPGGVTGDGKSSITKLVELLNSDPLRGEGTHAPLKRLNLDDEARQLLRRYSLDENSVPAEGEFVRLRRNANVATGGTPVSVFDQVHPDNKLLAIRAAAALRLDLAGVDLLIPDIGQSWKLGGAAVCEVNSQPNLGQTTAAHLYPRILKDLVHGNGRIPIAVVLGMDSDSTLVSDLGKALVENGLSAGCYDHQGIKIADECISVGEPLPADAVTVMLRDQQVDAVVINICDDSILKTGLSFDRFDVLILAGRNFRFPASMGTGEKGRRIGQIFRALFPACVGNVINLEDSGINLDTDPALLGETSVLRPMGVDSAISTAVKELLLADERHKNALQE